LVSHTSILNDYDFDDLNADDLTQNDRAQRRKVSRQPSRAAAAQPKRRPPRTEADQAFRCRKCRQFIGAPISGGRHRNHCPNCLHSLHVDLKHPGDRRSDCESLMRPRGLIERRNGEQMILHECLGCGKTQPTRVAADDNTVVLMRLEPIGLPEEAGEVAALIESEEIA
jgi:hypothetical protein